MINRQHTAVGGGCKSKSMPDAQLPYIDHLSIDQLRQRAADDRADALALIGGSSPGTLSMLLEDAERCEARATMLEQRCGDSIPGGLDDLTVEVAIVQLMHAARGRVVDDRAGRPGTPITAIKADILRNMDRGTAYAFVAHCADSTRLRLQSTPQPTLEGAYVAAVRCLTSMAVRQC